MSANDKAAATHGRQPKTITEQVAVILEDHQTRAGHESNDLTFTCLAIGCDWKRNVFGDENEAAAAHHAEVLAPFVAAREHEASRQAFADAANALDDMVKAGCDEPVDAADAADWLRARAEGDK